MIQYSIKEGSFSRDVNSALISLLLKRGKDPVECANYRPLSLLNADLKIYAKLLARRLQPFMTEVVHCDQTGFIKSRLATDNMRRLLHVIDGVQSSSSPAAVLSLDAMKAFDRLEWPFLWSVLESVGFGIPFINMIKVLYNNPTAVVLTGKTSSPPFPVMRGSRQGCLLSPLLFALSLEPLAQAIRSSPTISPISLNGTNHHISLYADDVLLYLNNPPQSIPHVLTAFEHYGKLSGFKINWQKSVMLPLNQAMGNASIPASIPVTKIFTYLGIEVFPSHITDKNFSNTLNKVVADLERWFSLPNSLCGRLAIIKMNILPTVNFVSLMLPLPPPAQYWSKLQTAISKFLWRGKRPCIKLTTMQREKQDGGLSLPNFKLYKWVFTLRPLLTWFQSDAQVSWRAMEERRLAPYFFYNFLHSNISIHQCRVRFGPLMSYLLSIWRKVEKLADCSAVLGPTFSNIQQ
uniref:Reverse transcriptase domain-containing protein n=1 Tax=Amphiprion ocellaris TaxID=80972 RepID=A0AAQ5YHX5_AMPOC